MIALASKSVSPDDDLDFKKVKEYNFMVELPIQYFSYDLG